MDNLPKPDLIIVDGGKIQIGAAKEMLAILELDIPVCGLKKMINIEPMLFYIMIW